MKQIEKTIRWSVGKDWHARGIEVFEVWSGLNLIKTFKRRNHAKKFARR